jgi:hypothetical protein
MDNITGKIPDITAELAINRLRMLSLTDENAVYFRTALDVFRQAGFLQVVSLRILQHTYSDDVKEHLMSASATIADAVVRRLLTNPQDVRLAAERFYQEIDNIQLIKSMLRDALTAASKIHDDNGKGEEFKRVTEMYLGFVGGINLMLNSDLPFVARRNDPITKEHGTVFLESQGLQIVVGPLTDRIGLHTAYIGPNKNFGHIHSTELADHPNWEYHFVLPGQNGSHVVGQYQCAMDRVHGDIVGVAVNTPHGGFNHGDIPLELHFCAGGDIPWDYPPMDLSPYDVTQSTHAKILDKVNGISLSSSLDRLGPGIHTLIDPRKFGGTYGIEFQAVVADGRGVEWESTGELVQVWSGLGTIEVAGTTMKAGDKSSLLQGVRYRIIPLGPKIIMLKFRMIDF